MTWWFRSAALGRFECMFDGLVATAWTARGGAAVGAWARVENAACARRLSAIADVLEARWAEDGSADRDHWCLDNWDAVAAEVAADHGVSLGVASHQLMVAMALRERLPRVDEVFSTGRIGFRLVNTIVSPHRTDHRPSRPREGRHRIGSSGAPAGAGCRRPRSSRASTTAWTATTRMRCGGRSVGPAVAMWTGLVRRCRLLDDRGGVVRSRRRGPRRTPGCDGARGV